MAGKGEVIEYEVRVKNSVGTVKDPVLSWCGSPKGGYLWVGDGDRCLFTIHGATLRKVKALMKDFNK